MIFYVPLFCVPKKGHPCSLAFGCPRETHAHGNDTNSHIRALRQRVVRIRVRTLRSAALQRGFKTQNLKKICSGRAARPRVFVDEKIQGMAKNYG